MATFLEVQEIFYSGGQAWRGNKELINDIAFLLDEKYLALSEVIIGSKQKYSVILDNLSSNKDAYDAAGGGKSHIALKLLAGKYLETRGFHKDEKICGYSFTAGDKLKEFLDFLENERREQFKKIAYGK